MKFHKPLERCIVIFQTAMNNLPTLSRISTRREFLRQAAGLGAVVAGLASASAVRASKGDEHFPIIDCHAHAGYGKTLLSPWTTWGDPEELIRNMDEAGIDQSVIFPNSNRTYEEANRVIAEYCRRWPTRFIGYAKHDAVTEGGRIREMLLREVREWGLRGYKSHAPQPNTEVLDTVAELRIPYIYHALRVSDVVDCARNYSSIDFIIAHLGSYGSRNPQEHLMAINAARQYDNIYLDTSTVLETRYLEMAIKEVGSHKICFGADAPDCDSRLEIYKVRMLGLPRQEEARILGGNLLRLLSKYDLGGKLP